MYMLTHIMEFNPEKYENAVGPMRAAQISLQLFITDTNNSISLRKDAETIYEWLGKAECTIDELFEISDEKSNFILNVLHKYPINTNNSNLIMNYCDAIESLEYQKKNTLC